MLTACIQCYCIEITDDVKAPPSTAGRRARQSALTRRRIIDAAAGLFASRGYAATTIEAIAGAADVAVETVYARFGNKRTLLSAYIDVTIAGDDEPVPILDREAARAIAAEPDQRRQIALMARLARDILGRTGPALRVMRGAAASDRALEDLVENLDGQRRRAQRAFLTMVAENGPFRADASFDDLCDSYSALATPETYAFLTQRCKWSPEKFEAWLADSLNRLLF